MAINVLISFRVSADNNCLYNAASIYFVGNESLTDILRLLTSIELFLHSAYYSAEIDNIWETLCDKTLFSNKLSMVKTLFRFESADNIVNLTDITKAFYQEAILNCETGQWASLVCVMALSSVIKSSIQSIYSPKRNTKLFNIFTRKFNPRNISNPQIMTLLWSSTEGKTEYDRPNHFVVCLEDHKISKTDFNTVVQDVGNWLDRYNPAPIQNSSSALTTNIQSNKKTASKRSSTQTKLTFAPTKKRLTDDTMDDSVATNNAQCETIASGEKQKVHSPSTKPLISHTTDKNESVSTSTLNMILKPDNQVQDRGSCENINTIRKPISRGEPVKGRNECSKYDIGLHYDKVRNMNDNEKYDLLKNIWKPPAGYIFPQHSDNNRNWRINSAYLSEKSNSYLPWLTYSEYLDGAFCLPCVFFAHECGSKLKRLYTEPFTRWNGAASRWAQHDSSPSHRFATTAFHEYKAQMEGRSKRISEVVSTEMRNRIANNRKVLLPIIKTVVLCGRQNFALRGHRDDLKHINDKSVNSGNFQALLDFRIDAGDTVLKEHFEKAPKNATYRSKTIQNEIIASCGKYIQEKILSEIKDAKFFSVIADEATDASNTEQLSLVIRFVDESGEIREEFMEFIRCPGLSGECIAELIKTAITTYGLDLRNLRGQGYDGAGNMAGPKSGLATRIRRDYPLALYFHCSSHRLNLVVAQGCKHQQVVNMMDAVKKCSDIFRFSAKKQLLLERCIDQHSPEEKRTKLKDVCRTRWLLRLDGMERVQEMYKPIVEALESIKDNIDGSYKQDARSDANGVYSVLSSFIFINSLILVRNVLAYTHPLTFELQKKQLDVLSVYAAVDNVFEALQDCRDNVDEKHAEWYRSAVTFASNHEISEMTSRRVGMQVYRENHPAESASEYYKRALTIPFLDSMLIQLRERFSPAHRIHSNGFFLVPAQVIKLNDWKGHVLSFAAQYENDLPNILRLQSELELWERFWKKESDANRVVPDNITDTLKEVISKKVKEWYPNIYTILVLIGVVPASSNSCERSISKLRLLETYLRSTMSQERLNGLALLYAHYDVTIDYEKITDIFATDYRHRLQFIDILSSD